MTEEKFFFEDQFILFPLWQRFIYRLIFSFFVFFGLSFSLIIIFLGLERWIYLGVLGFFFFFYVFIKQNLPDRLIKDEMPLKDKVNLASLLALRMKNVIAEAKDIAVNSKLPFSFAVFKLLLKEPTIIEALEYLSLSAKDIKDIQQAVDQEKSDDFQGDFKEFVLKLSKSALIEAQALKRNHLDAPSLFLSLFSSDFSESEKIKNIFNFYKIEKNDLAISFLINDLSKIRNIEIIKGLAERKSFFRPRKSKVNQALTSKPTPFLDIFGIDYTELAQQLKIGIMIGHREEYESMVNILSRLGKKNVLLLGPAGIGKETIVSYLAYNLARDKVPKQIRDFRLISLPLSSVVSDTQNPFEIYDRITKITREISSNPDIILYLPDLHSYKQLTQEGGLSAFDILRPLFSSSPLPFIAASAPDEYRRYLERDSLIKENFEIIRVGEVSLKDAIKILAYQSLRWRKERKVKISFQAIKRAVSLAYRFLANIPLPSSAESLITEAIEGARQKGKQIILEEDIVNLVSIKTGIPLEITKKEEKERLLDLEKIIHQYLVNQEEAVKIASSSLRQYRAGLSNPDRPVGAFLFVGPTGVGKTELAKTLAKIYFGSEKTMVRFDMSEYQDPRSIFRFIGDPEGERAGSLTEAIKKMPFSLILLDEFEKAHQKVLDIFLQVFDEGRLTDNLGQTIDFTHTIIIATSNARSDFVKDEIEKETPFTELTEKLKKKLVDFFKPELINRFDEVVVFRPLAKEHLREIVGLKLGNLAKSLYQTKRIEVMFDDSIINKIADLGFNPIFGARPLDSVIRHLIRENLARAILKEKIKAGSKIFFAVEGDKVKIDFK